MLRRSETSLQNRTRCSVLYVHLKTGLGVLGRMSGRPVKPFKKDKVAVRNLITSATDDAVGEGFDSESYDDERSREKRKAEDGGPESKKRRRWTPEEDTLLTRLQREEGHKGWEHIGNQFPGRTSRQVRLRYVNHLREGLKSSVDEAFSAEEDELILHLQRECGNKWSQIARHMQGRSDNAIKNRWNTLMRRREREMKERHSVPQRHEKD
mmetsp:Transcript_6077/g.14735  ORF Transcript_6077/g.14735 Transcript_6077/m.14735 type:complete len:210 (+) Transcript_6077:489-1118(+)